MAEKRKKNPDFVPIGQIIESIVARYRGGTDVKMAAIFGVWESVVGKVVAANARPVAFKGSLLLVHVSSSPWLQQLQFLKSDIIGKLNGSLGENPVKEIKFKIGPV